LISRLISNVEEDVEEMGTAVTISTGPACEAPARVGTRFSADNVVSVDHRLFSGAFDTHRQIHNSYYYC
jgi:hypothetical protein